MRNPGSITAAHIVARLLAPLLCAAAAGCVTVPWSYTARPNPEMIDMGITVQVGPIENKLDGRDPRKIAEQSGVKFDIPLADACRDAISKELQQAGYTAGESDIRITGTFTEGNPIDFTLSLTNEETSQVLFAKGCPMGNKFPCRELYSGPYYANQDCVLAFPLALQRCILQVLDDPAARDILYASATNTRAKALKAAERAADAAAKAGDHEEALAQFVLALENAVRKKDDDRLRRKVVRFARSLASPPAPTEDAVRRTVRARALIKQAKDESGFVAAAKELRAAAGAAPWWPDAYYNLGVTLEAAKRFPEAIENLNWFLLAAPDSPDAAAVKTKIYELEVAAKAAGAPEERPASPGPRKAEKRPRACAPACAPE